MLPANRRSGVKYRSLGFQEQRSHGIELGLELPSTRFENQNFAGRGGRVSRLSPPDCTHLEARAQTVLRDTDEATVTPGTREIDVRGSGAGSALTPTSSFDPRPRL